MVPRFEVCYNQVLPVLVVIHLNLINGDLPQLYYYGRSSIIENTNYNKCFSGKQTILRSLIGICRISNKKR